MKTYQYRGFDREGRAARGLIEGLSPKDVRERLAVAGILAEELRETGSVARFPLAVRAVVYRELGSLLVAGLPILRALDLLVNSPELTTVALPLAGIRDSVREGLSLADALKKASDSVSACEVALLRAGEQSGSIEKMLEGLASFLEEQEELREKIRSALIYPVIVITAGICVAILMLGLLLPRTREIVAGNRMPLPLITAFLLGVGRWAKVWIPAGLGLLGLLWILVHRRWRNDPDFRLACHRFVLRLPVLGRGLGILANLRFAHTFAVLLKGGVDAIEGFKLAGRATGNEWIAALTEREAEAVRHGIRLADAVRHIGPLAEGLPGWIETGEASGGLAELLERAAERYQARWERFLQRSLALLEPLLILLTGGFVLVITLAVLLPILTLSRSLVR
ncbi:MAG: type II secretion system F family protein [Kiritimatiellia bacterium]